MWRGGGKAEGEGMVKLWISVLKLKTVGTTQPRPRSQKAIFGTVTNMTDKIMKVIAN